MKNSSLAQRVLILLLFLFANILQAQNKQQQKPEFYNTIRLITYLDGTPAKRLPAEYFDIVFTSASTKYVGYVCKVVDDSVKFCKLLPAGYKLLFMGTEVARFTVSKQNNKLISDLPRVLRLPFNYLIKSDTIINVAVYDKTGNKTKTITTNKYGYATITEPENTVQNSFFVAFFKDHFPQIKTIGTSNPKYKGNFSNHKVIFNKPTYRRLSRTNYSTIGDNTIYNIDKGIYYKILRLKLPSKESNNKYHYWLMIYNEPANKSSVHKLDFGGQLILDENGKAILVRTNKDGGEEKVETYIVNDNGSLQLTNNSYVYPSYRFNGNFVGSTNWLVPVYLGQPMKEGQHSFIINCESKGGDKMTSDVSVSVVYSPEKHRLRYKNPDGSLADYPVIQDPKVDFDKLNNIKQCKLTVDGKITVDYTHIDMSMAKGIFYSDMSEQEKQEAKKNLSLIPGWDEDFNPGASQINLFYGSEYEKALGPVNKKIGPYPKLRYIAYKPAGDYDNYNEARKHCKNPKASRSYNKKYFRCYEQHIVEVCLDNYRTITKDNRSTVDFDALFCGEGTEDNNKGDQIVFEVEKPGYAIKTGALSKRSMQASGFTLTGTVVDKQGKPVKQAIIKFRDKEGFVYSDSAGRFVIKTSGEGNDKEPFKEEVTIQLTKIGLTIFNEELGKQVADTFGIVSDGFTTLKLKVIANGVEPRTVTVKQPSLGEFTGQTMLKLPLVMDEDGTGSMEYVPPEYLTSAQLNKHLKLKTDSISKSGLAPMLWVAEVPVTVTYEDEEGNPGSQTFIIYVTRPPVMLIHGFTGDETTWATLANYLRGHKYETIVREYYKGPVDESTIERQAEKLGKYIQELRADYLTNGFLQNRVDIVAHSMGGLISRYYISNMAKYGKTAGIYIPYNVKLSRDQIKAQRFQKPVILNDVRKLIMVGTPNHGASPIDERIGYWSSKITGYHQIASAQLRSDSPFFEKLNAGESEGRHLDPNVQYALIYGIRKRSAFYLPDSWFHTWGTSQKEFASDDGVVTISSARLNGVKDFPFPKDWFAIHGYIHSPAIQAAFPEDEPITESTNIFEKIDELLLEDIPRMPLKNSSAKIIRGRGDVHYRYFSTQNWIPLKTPFAPGNAKKLENNWCRIKTGDGSAELGFFLNGHQWGALYIMPNTIAYYEYASPEFVNVYIRQGKARFRSRKMNGGSFQIVLGNEGEKWYAFNPKAKVMDINTDFTVESENGSAKVQSIYGMVAVGTDDKINKQVKEKSIGKKQGISITGDGSMTGFEVPDKGWWSSVDTTYLPDDTASLIQDSTLVHFQIGEVKITCENDYLPVSGFTGLMVHIDSLPDTLLMVEVSLDNSRLLPFIGLSVPAGTIDSTGSFKTDITFREPSETEVEQLINLPLTATFTAKIIFPPTGQVLAENQISLPLGMTLILGKTVDADFKTRNEPAPPELYPTRYQLINQTDENGNFYILFNTTLFEKEIARQKKYAERTRQSFDNNKFRLSVQWSENCSIPLTYELPDSITGQIKSGKQITIGRNGYFDLLSPEEHEQRIKKYVEQFAQEIPLKSEIKSKLFSKLNELEFKYNVSEISTPSFKDNLNYKPVIEIPLSKKDFWGTKINEKTDPAYVLIFHVFGHFIQQVVELPGHRYYNFLSRQCAGSNNLFVQKEDKLKYMFDNSEYVSFSEAGADFFSYLLMQYLMQTDTGFVSKSIYFRKGYLDELVNKQHSVAVKKKFSPWLVSGPQTTFLLTCYAGDIVKQPAKVYGDYLYNTMQYSAYTKGGDPAATINEWILAKHLSYKNKKFAGNSDPVSAARDFGLVNEVSTFRLIPVSDYRNAEISINNNTVSNFSQIPAVDLPGGTVNLSKGNFILIITSVDTIKLIEIQQGAGFSTKADSLTLLSGTFTFYAPVGFKTSLATFQSAGNYFTVTLEPKDTFIKVYKGSLKINSVKDEETVSSGFKTTMSKSGRIKKPKMMKPEELPSDKEKAQNRF